MAHGPEEEPVLPDPGAYFQIANTATPEPMPGVLEETPQPARGRDAFDEELRLMQERKRRRNMLVGLLGFAAIAAVVVALGVGAFLNPDIIAGWMPETSGTEDDNGLEPVQPVAPVQVDPKVAEQPEVAPPDPEPDPKTKATPNPPPKPVPPKPPSADKLLDRGWAATDRGAHSEAVGLFDQILADAPQNAEALYGKGYALAKMNRTDDAVPVLCKAAGLASAELDNEIRRVMGNLGMSCP